jgi:uncharacterized protein YgbK (DUF1537 family)
VTVARAGRVVVLDDDPTGTQGVSGLPIVLRPDAATLEGIRRTWGGPVWMLTNTRAMPEADAVATLTEMTGAIRRELGDDVRFVLRGDSTLRGHVLAEFDALAQPDSVNLFVPAFLEAGRVTVGGVHYTEVDGRRVEVAQTEYAHDHAFGYHSSRLTDFVTDRDPERTAIPFDSESLRAADGVTSLRSILLGAPAGAVIVPDAETTADLEVIAAAWESAGAGGRHVVLRCAASLASVVTDSPPRRIAAPTGRASVLVVCGSYTAGARDQLAALDAAHPTSQVGVDIAAALGEGASEYAERLADAMTKDLRGGGVVVLSTPRSTSPEHLNLAAGEALMDVVIGAVRALGVRPGLVISKGGITGARVARDGFAADIATVLGQPAPGVPLWRLRLPDGRDLDQLVVPGNVGTPALIADAVGFALG